jgi:23S rRNA pseudouridine2457 synthase
MALFKNSKQEESTKICYDGSMPRYILFHKPYNVLCQFTGGEGEHTLSSFGLPKGIYPAGRLDKDSEGLLLLTDDGALIERLLNPKSEKEKTYLVLVERIPTEESLQRFRHGLKIEDYTTLPAKIEILAPQPTIPPRDPPVRFRKTVQDIWVEIKIVEGKNRQVRKMTAAIGHPTLRLMRTKILNLDLGQLAPGEWREIERSEINV